MHATNYYSKLRLELAEMLDEHSTIEEGNTTGGLMTSAFSSEGNAGLLRRIGEVRGLASELVEIAKDSNRLSNSLTDQINQKLNQKFPKKNKLFGSGTKSAFPYRLGTA